MYWFLGALLYFLIGTYILESLETANQAHGYCLH